MTPVKKHILVLPRWYPNKSNDQLGVFIERQVDLMKEDFLFTVVYAQGITDLNVAYELDVNRAENVTTIIIYFKQTTGLFRKIINFFRYRHAIQLGHGQCNTKFDLSHVHVPYRTVGSALKLRRKKKVPLLITEHWSGHLNGQYNAKNFLDKLIYRSVLKRSKKISTVSNALQTAFKKNTGFDSFLIPNIIEVGPAIERIVSDKIEILSVADFIDDIKNISGILKAYRAVLNSHKNLHLTLVGGGPDEEKLNQLIRELHFPEQTLTLKGRQNHEYVLAEMGKCDFYICNSRFETFGMTVAEALMVGKPVICTRCGGPNEFLSNSNSIQIDPAPSGQSNTIQLQRAMEEMIHSYKSFNAISISQNIEDKFGSNAVRAKWLDFYNG